MDVTPIKTDADFRAALAEIERLWDVEPDTPDDDRLARIIHQRFETAARRRVDGWRQRRGMMGLEGCGDRFVRGHVAPAVTAAA